MEMPLRVCIGKNHYGDDDIYGEERRGVIRVSNKGFLLSFFLKFLLPQDF